ncbi:hypothetical protein BP5796_05799 [Coleophoma crateriformis]|uniref:Vacuolar membrane protein n=1 Tax=Coleophoma crateriformis TaxID=565419 RepID=A0A3D8RV55_9HELO|nr:hypothetical protein BP5796_05799 [Coleophoma crateriformis]
MLPPPGLAPSSVENALPTILSTISSAVATASLDMPSATQTFAVIAATATALTDLHNTGHHDQPGPPPQEGECKLLGPFAILVQGALGSCALLALVYKRWRERPQRPLKIWTFDVSKQVVGSILVHMANLLMSMMSSGQFDLKGEYSPNPCSFYLLNLAIDTTIGIPILIVLLRIFTGLFSMTSFGEPRESIESGHYGTPPRVWWWFKQCIIYFLGLMGMKLCVLIIFLVLPWISRVGDWALGWTEGNEVLQVLFVMLVFPVIMNATQYYIIDSFIKNQSPNEHEILPHGDGEDHDSFNDTHHPYEDPRSGSSEEINSGDEDESASLSEDKTQPQDAPKKRTKRPFSSGSGRAKELRTGSRDYDPIYDGESSPTVVGSASSPRKLVSTDDSEDEQDVVAKK